jgi:hypothetical protein
MSVISVAILILVSNVFSPVKMRVFYYLVDWFIVNNTTQETACVTKTGILQRMLNRKLKHTKSAITSVS